MKKKYCALLIVIFVGFNSWILAGQSYIQQKKGVLQDRPGEHLTFELFEKVPFDFTKIPLKGVKRIRLHNGFIYILDGKRNELYVLNKKGKHIRTIGRHGQGPHEILYGSDFFISPDDHIYILNSMPKRIAVFDLEGKGIKSIRLTLPEEYHSFPSSFMMDSDGRFIVGTKLNHLVSRFLPTGDYIDTLLKAEKEVDFWSSNIAGQFQLAFAGKNICVFDTYTGSFKLLEYPPKRSFEGGCATECSLYLPAQDKYMKTIEQEAVKKNNRGVFSVNVLSFKLWAGCVVDKSGRIYSIPMAGTKKRVPLLFCFSPDGLYLYKKTLPGLKDHIIDHFDGDDDCLIFLSLNFELFIGYKGGNNK